MEIRTDLTPAEVKDRLCSVADNVGIPIPFQFYSGPFDHLFRDHRPGTKRYLGSINRYRFDIQIRRRSIDHFPIICSGEIRAKNAGCIVTVRLGFPIWTRMMLPFMAVGPFMMWMMFPDGFLWRGMMLWLAALISLPFFAWWLRRRDGDELLELVQGTLASPRLSSTSAAGA